MIYACQEVEEVEDKMRKEVIDLKKKVSMMHKKVTIKRNEIQSLQDKASYFKCKNELIESEKEISSLKQDSKCEQLKEKISKLEAVLKNKTEMLVTAPKEKG